MDQMMNNIQQCEARIRGLKDTLKYYTKIMANELPCPTHLPPHIDLPTAHDNVWNEAVHYRNILKQLETDQ